MKKDTRIPYGMHCTWWDSIDKVGSRSGLPCCPHCKGMLFEVPSEKEWFAGVDYHEANGHPGYRAMIEWARGKCFPDMAAVKAAYDSRQEGPEDSIMVEARALLMKLHGATELGQRVEWIADALRARDIRAISIVEEVRDQAKTFREGSLMGGQTIWSAAGAIAACNDIQKRISGSAEGADAS